MTRANQERHEKRSQYTRRQDLRNERKRSKNDDDDDNNKGESSENNNRLHLLSAD